MSIIDTMAKRIVADADLIPAEEIARLPRLPLEDRYGMTFVAVNDENMIISRGVPDFQMALHVKGRDRVVFHTERYIDCPHCRRQRKAFADRLLADGATVESLPERLAEAKRRENYWCNQCQGLGWITEPLQDCVARLGLTTWEARAKALPTEDLIALSKLQRFQTPWPLSVVTAEMAARLNGAVQHVTPDPRDEEMYRFASFMRAFMDNCTTDHDLAAFVQTLAADIVSDFRAGVNGHESAYRLQKLHCPD